MRIIPSGFYFSGLLIASCLTAPSAALAYRNTHEVPLLGGYLSNVSGTPAYYSSSRPAALSGNVMPLYPERFSAPSASEKQVATTDKPNDIAKTQPPSSKVMEAPAATSMAVASTSAAISQPHVDDTPAEATALPVSSSSQGDEENGTIQLASADMPSSVSPLAIPVSQMQLPPPPSSDAIRAFEKKHAQTLPAPEITPPATEVPEHSPLQPIAQPAPAVRSAELSPISDAGVVHEKSTSQQPAKDIIEPGISYAPEPNLVAPLSNQSKQVLASFPSGIDSPKPAQASKISLNRTSPDIQKLVMPNKPDAAYEAAGIKIEVRRPGLDTNHELMRAYDTLMAGNVSEAVAIYRDILSVEPNNTEALFGLAATLHRSGVTDKARPLYARLLKINPQHREALNNYLSLVGDEAPESALLELERLRLRNPNFSPIPAQMGLLYAKTGNFLQARAALMSAIQLAPENLVYQYNLAIILDQYGEIADAAALYSSLLKADASGAPLPFDKETVQKRHNYISALLAKGTKLSSAQ